MANEFNDNNIYCPECTEKSNKRINTARQIIFDTIKGLEVSRVEIIYTLDIIKFQLIADGFGIKPTEDDSDESV